MTQAKGGKLRIWGWDSAPQGIEPVGLWTLSRDCKFSVGRQQQNISVSQKPEIATFLSFYPKNWLHIWNDDILYINLGYCNCILE